jgi:hypothetical protein
MEYNFSYHKQYKRFVLDFDVEKQNEILKWCVGKRYVHIECFLVHNRFGLSETDDDICTMLLGCHRNTAQVESE